MRAALLADLAELPGIEVYATADPRLCVSTPAGVRVLPPAGEAGDAFRCLVEQVDAVWLIAPETDGVLERLTAVVEQTRRFVIGAGSAVIRRVSDKAWLARRLAVRGVPVPSETGDALPVVVKPRRGAGCGGVHLARTRAEVVRAKARIREVTGDGALVQGYVAGVPASVSLVCDGRRAIPLAVNVQHVRPGRPFTYHGGETPLRHPLAGRAVERALAACDALPGLVGYVGVDIVLTADDAIVIEVNPRLTTAYVGLRHVLDVNVAALVLAASAGALSGAAPTARGRVRFSIDGRVEPIEARATDEAREPAPPSAPPAAEGRTFYSVRGS